MYIDGQKTKNGQVKIYGVIARGVDTGVAPAVLVLSDFSRPFDEKTAIDLAKRGFVALAIDLVGKADGVKNFTEYPDDIEYANYHTIKDKIDFIENDVTGTCWYEWTVVARYALAFFKNMIGIVSVGGLGLGDASTVLWQVAGTDNGLDCAVFVLDSGWRGYRGLGKFDGGFEPQFSDERYKFIAGIEPEAYASHVQCPVLMLASTNSNVYDCDRAYDTVSRIDDGVYRAVHYSSGCIDSVNTEAYENALMFFRSYLKKDKKVYLPEELEVKGDILDGKLVATVAPDIKDVEEVSLYVSEGMSEPALRCWNKISKPISVDKGVYSFEYSPYQESGITVFYAVAKYKSGFSICSPIQAKRFKENEVGFSYKSKIIYSSRVEDAESAFFASKCRNTASDRILLKGEGEVRVKKGPMGIEGVCSECGIMTFKMTTAKDKPVENAMLMFDIYAKEDTEYTVSLITDYFGERTVYYATGSIRGGDIWHNVQINRSKFKTAEGRPLKDYDKVQALGFETEKEGLINNALWV